MNNTPTKETKGLDPKFAAISEGKAEDAIMMAIKMCSDDPASNSEAILAVDQRFFCEGNKALPGERIEAITTLMQVFVNDPTDDAENDPSMKRALPQDQGRVDEPNVFKRVIRQAERLSERFIAGILLLDIVSFSWHKHNFEAQQTNLLHVSTINLYSFEILTNGFTQSQRIMDMLLKPDFADYSLRNLQARIVANLILHQIFQHQPDTEEFNQEIRQTIEPITEKITEDEFTAADLGLRVLRLILEIVDEKDSGLARSMHALVPIAMPSLFEAFTNDEEIGVHGREQILNLFYLLIRMVAWADGRDNELVQECLGETFQSWMALFLQLIQSNPKQYFNLKKNALKCLVVIFRDLINFSKDSINLILKPAWKLLNSHLPIFTEVVAYNQPIESLRAEDDEQEEEDNAGDKQDAGNESFLDEEVYGVEGMTFHLLELLSSLVLRLNV